MFTRPLESDTRDWINNLLINLGWILEKGNPKRNCFFEQARTEEENLKFKGNRPDYVLYSSDDFQPLAIIEAKREGKSLKEALDQAINKYAIPLDIDIVFVTDGIFIQTYSIKDEDFLYYNSEIVTEFLNEKRLKLFVKTGSKIFSESKVRHTKIELIKVFKEANDILRKDGLSEGKERFTEFANLLFLKLISDIEAQRELNGEKRKLDVIYCWDYYKDKPAIELYNYINDTVLRELDKNYNKSEKIFNNKLNINKCENLRDIIKKISELGNLLDTNSDIKGDAFEYFLKNSISVGNDLGEYFTPRHIVKLMIELIDLKFYETVYDPCCGTGGFLIEAFKNIGIKCKQTSENIGILERHTIFGREITNTAKIAKMNMIIMGDGHNNVEQKDCLEFPITKNSAFNSEHDDYLNSKNEDDKRFDVVLSNYAFSQKTNFGIYYGFETTDANPIFLKHIFDSLKNTGRAAVVVPEGVLFDLSSENIKIRKILVEQSNIIAIIRLHSFVFKPYTGQPTSIIVFDKSEKTKDVWFFDVEQDGYQKTSSKKGRKKINDDDIILLKQIWKDKLTTSKSFFVNKTQIIDNKYSLSFSTYQDKTKYRKTVKLKSLVKDNKIIIGFTPPTNDESNWFGGSNIWVRISDMTDQMYIDDSSQYITDKAIKENKLLPAGTLLFSFKLTIGKVAITKNPLYTNEAIAGLVINDPIIRKYLYYILPTLDYTANRAAKGNTLNKDTVGDIDIPFDEKIVPVLVKELDDLEREKQQLIERKNKIQLTMLKKIKSTIF